MTVMPTRIKDLSFQSVGEARKMKNWYFRGETTSSGGAGAGGIKTRMLGARSKTNEAPKNARMMESGEARSETGRRRRRH